MIREEIKKQIFSVEFVISILLLYMVFMLGSCIGIIPGKESVSVIEAVWNKMHNNWAGGVESLAVLKMKSVWTDNSYLPIVAPVILGLPFISRYIEEVTTRNKRLMIIRAGIKKYYLSKVVSNIITCMMIAALALALYDITLLRFFDGISVNDNNGLYDVVCQLLLGRSGEMNEIYLAIVKSNMYFIIYAVISGAFCFMITVICRDKYITLGAAVLISYVQCRLQDEFRSIHFTENSERAEIIADILDPMFLHYAGKNGFYGDKEHIALFVAVCLIGVFYGIVYIYYKQQTDISEK